MNTLVVNFSGRQSNGKGNCEQVGRYIIELLGEDSKLINYSTLNISPCNRCEYECLFNTPVQCRFSCDDLSSLYDAIQSSDFIYFIIPVYSDYPCSNYFTFRERGQGYFNDENYLEFSGKIIKFVIISNTGYYNVLNVIKNDFPNIHDDSILLLSSNDYGQKSKDGCLHSAAGVKEKIKHFIDT